MEKEFFVVYTFLESRIENGEAPTAVNMRGIYDTYNEAEEAAIVNSFNINNRDFDLLIIEEVVPGFVPKIKGRTFLEVKGNSVQGEVNYREKIEFEEPFGIIPLFVEFVRGQS